MAMAEASTRGRPRALVDWEKLEFLKSLHFTWEDVSAIVGVSAKTLQRRAKEWNICTYFTLTDSELDDIVRQHLRNFPTCWGGNAHWTFTCK